MNFLIYIFLFLALNMVMSISPALGMILYFGFIAYIVSSSRKRMRSFGQRTYTNTQQGYANQQQYTNTETSGDAKASAENEKKIKDAIDVEFSEEEIY